MHHRGPIVWLLFAHVVWLAGCSAIVDTSAFTSGVVTARAGEDRIVPLASTVVLDAGTSDQSKGRPLYFRWVQTSGPTVELGVDGATATFVAPSEVARLSFDVYVTDRVHGEVSDSLTIDVDSTPQLVTAPELDLMTARTAYLDGSQSWDPDDEPLTFHWAQTDGPTVDLADPNTPIASFTTPDTKSSFAFQLTVCDATGACDTRSVTVRVHEWTQIAAGGATVFALRSDGTVWGWGSDQFGALGRGLRTSGDTNHPLQVRSVAKATYVWAGLGGTSFARIADGLDVTWGRNCYGEAARTATQVCDTYQEATAVDLAYDDALSFANQATAEGSGLIVSGSAQLTGIGYNTNGERGDCSVGGSGTTSFGATQWASVAASPSGRFAAGIERTGFFYAWGLNDHGVFGSGSPSTTCATPAIRLYSGITRTFSLGWDHVVAIWNDHLFSWGAMEAGGTADALSPVLRGNRTDWSQVAAGQRHSLALTSTGELHAWGVNDHGELGFDTSPNTSAYPVSPNEPPQVGSDVDWKAIAAAGYASFALKTNGSLWSWGSGPLGLGAVSSATVPTRVVDGPTRCGDGVIDPSTEACDDGPRNGSPGRCAASCRCANTRVLYVDASAAGASDGSSWSDAFPTLQAAVDAAGTCDTIWLARGTYTSGSTSAAIPVVTMKANSEIYGGFAGYETHFAQRSPARNPSILDGQGVAYHVVMAAANGALDGLTIRAGHASAGSVDANGGGLLLQPVGQTVFQLRNVVFEGNSAVGSGGAVYASPGANQKGELRVDACRFVSNSAASGGAISAGEHIVGARVILRIRDSHFQANMGGAVLAEGRYSSYDIASSSFVGNYGAALSAGMPGSFRWNSVYGTVSSGSAIQGGLILMVEGSVLWNPASAAEVASATGIKGSCYRGASGGNVDIAASGSPFDLVDVAGEQRPFLSATTPCRNAGGTSTEPSWYVQTTTADGALDAPPVDPGRHWNP